MDAIRVHKLSKSFGGKLILDEISLDLQTGMIHGLIGDNGSGKSVLLKCICGILPCDSGSICICGQNVKPGSNHQPFTGVIIEHPGFINTLSGWQNLKYLAGIRGRATDDMIRHALSCTGLEKFAKMKVRKYSLGMRQKLAIAQALMEEPMVYIMDEPFNGLDRTSTTNMHSLFGMLKETGCTFLLVSHHASDIEGLCDDIYEIVDGSIVKRR